MIAMVAATGLAVESLDKLEGGACADPAAAAAHLLARMQHLTTAR